MVFATSLPVNNLTCFMSWSDLTFNPPALYTVWTHKLLLSINLLVKKKKCEVSCVFFLFVCFSSIWITIVQVRFAFWQNRGQTESSAVKQICYTQFTRKRYENRFERKVHADSLQLSLRLHVNWGGGELNLWVHTYISNFPRTILSFKLQ